MQVKTLVLGDNEITDCDAALVVDGEEVFRLRERARDGKFIVDFDLRGGDEARIAKVSKNYVAYVAPGYRFENLTGIAEVIHEEGGTVVARVRELTPDKVQVTGTFIVKGFKVDITDDGLTMPGVRLSGNRIVGFGKAIALNHNSFQIGLSQ